jgi:hypothetical protein
MNRYSLCLVISAAVLTGFSGAARAEINESPAPTQPQVKMDRPAPVPIPRPHPLASHRILPDQTAAAATPQPVCDGFACGQYVIVGIGF